MIEQVKYPPKCEGICKLPEALLRQIDHTLSANCPGPTTLYDGQVRTEITSHGGEVSCADIAFGNEDIAKRACRNPRVIKLGRDMVDRSFGSST